MDNLDEIVIRNINQYYQEEIDGILIMTKKDKLKLYRVGTQHFDSYADAEAYKYSEDGKDGKLVYVLVNGIYRSLWNGEYIVIGKDKASVCIFSTYEDAKRHKNNLIQLYQEEQVDAVVNVGKAVYFNKRIILWEDVQQPSAQAQLTREDVLAKIKELKLEEKWKSDTFVGAYNLTFANEVLDDIIEIVGGKRYGPRDGDDVLRTRDVSIPFARKLYGIDGVN